MKESKKIDDSIEGAIARLQKKYGEGAVIKMDEESDFVTERFSSGCFSLDEALGGGIPKSRIIEVFGKESSGKSVLCTFLMAQVQKNGGMAALIDAECCIDENSEIFNPLTGEMKTIKEICNNNLKYNVISLNKKEVFINSLVVAKKESSKKVNGLLLTTKLGKKIKCTSEHQVYVYKRGWVNAQDLTLNDYIASVKKYNNFGLRNEVKKAKLLGYMLGDGYIPNKGSLSLVIKDPAVYDDLEKVIIFFGSSIKNGRKDPKSITYRISEKGRGGYKRGENKGQTEIQDIFSKWGLRGSHSNTKFIPSEVFSDWDKESVASLIQSLWMTDGTVNNSLRKTISYSSSSYKLIKQLQHLLLRFGIHSLLTEHEDVRKETYFKMFILSINGLSQLRIFNEEISLIGLKGERLRKSISSFKKHKRFIGEMLPDYKSNIHFRKNKDEYINNSDILWDKIAKIEKTKLVPYDITIKDNHNFIANDILVHNCFDGAFAKNIGVDVSKLLVSQPSTLEEAMDILRELINTRKFDLIVIDSVAALTPKVEVEGVEMLKESMALVARLMSKALRILSSEISKSGTAVIFINQIRDKVGVFFGAKTTQPGGKALKFFSSIRIDVQAGEKIKGEGEEQIGNWIKIKTAKNKTAPPWREAQFELYYATGIDLEGDALDYAEKKGIIKKSGHSYSFGDIKLGANRPMAKKYLKEHQDIYASLVKTIKEYEKK